MSENPCNGLLPYSIHAFIHFINTSFLISNWKWFVDARWEMNQLKHVATRKELAIVNEVHSISLKYSPLQNVGSPKG